MKFKRNYSNKYKNSTILSLALLLTGTSSLYNKLEVFASDYIVSYSVEDDSEVEDIYTISNVITEKNSEKFTKVFIGTNKGFRDVLTIQGNIGATINLGGMTSSSVEFLVSNEDGDSPQEDSYSLIDFDLEQTRHINMEWEDNSLEYIEKYILENPFDEDNFYETYGYLGTYEDYINIVTAYVWNELDEVGMTDDSFIRFNKGGRYLVHVQNAHFALSKLDKAIVIEIVDETGEVPETFFKIEPPVFTTDDYDDSSNLLLDLSVVDELLVDELLVDELLVDELLVSPTIPENISPEIIDDFIETEETTDFINSNDTSILEDTKDTENSNKLYTVSKNETLLEIAFNNYGTSNVINSIATVNNISSVKEGMVITLPKVIGAYKLLDGVNNNLGIIHTIQFGETLSKISANYYGTSSKYINIYNANSDRLVSPNLIYEGQHIIIPQ